MRIIDILLEKEKLRRYIFRFNSYLKKATGIIDAYQGHEPLSSFLKKTFAAEKKYGSNDRKNISELCYYYFRLGNAVKWLRTEERILIGIFLSENVSNEHLQLHKPEWDSNIHLSLDSKIILTGYSFSVTDIFPFKDELSRQIPHKRFSVSHLIQPLLFLRLRKKTRHMLMAKIEKACWQYSMPDQDCIALPNGTRTDEIIRIDDEAVIQDYNSQQVFNFLKKESVQESLDKFRKYHLQFRHVKILKAWDCCAASGGKTILLYDLLHHSLKPTVSDIRFSILLNLHKRFKKANIRYYDYFIGDFEKKIFPEAADSPFPIIICDAPCTGSGTWSRTPEQLYYFKKETIQVYSERQKRIVHNVLPFLAAGGLFFYITCSAFKQENEEIAAFIQNKPGYKQVFTELLKGWDKRADTMFVAVFRREF